MPFKNTTASLVLAMPCLSINFYNQKSAYYQVLSFGALSFSNDRDRSQKSLKSSQNRRLTSKNALFLHEKTKIRGLHTKKSEVLASNLSYLFFIVEQTQANEHRL